MKKPIPVVLSVQRGHLVCDVEGVPGWDGFEKLLQYLEINWDAVLVARFDGPDACRAVMQVRDVELALEFDDGWGNSIVAISPAADVILREIASDLRTRLAGAT